MSHGQQASSLSIGTSPTWFILIVKVLTSLGQLASVTGNPGDRR